jgi:hypothetical protein
MKRTGLLPVPPGVGGVVVEAGAGKGFLGGALAEAGLGVERLVLLDNRANYRSKVGRLPAGCSVGVLVGRRGGVGVRGFVRGRWGAKRALRANFRNFRERCP